MNSNKDIYILGIETSCDETSASIVKNGRKVLSNIISSQIDIHKKFGGVVPEIASRKHIEIISTVVDEAINCSGVSLTKVDGIAVTYGPGLVGALLVGLSYAKALAYSINKPLIGVHHIEGHICANYIENENLTPPFVCLVVSGGHTNIVHVKDYGEYEVLGQTRDDAAGEAYDKVARVCGLGYPGGPKIDNLSTKGNSNAIEFPKIMLEEGSFDFSFSGLKSAVLNYVNKCKMTNIKINEADIAASFQKSVIDVLTTKTISACKKLSINKVAMAGGVSCNTTLRDKMKSLCLENDYSLHIPEPVYCTDNAAMISSCGYFSFLKGITFGLDLNAYPNLKLH